MKSARFFQIFVATLLVLFCSLSVVAWAYDITPGDTYRDQSPTYEPTVQKQTECELHPEWTYCKTGSLATVTYFNKITMLIGGRPTVTVNGQTYKGDKGAIGFLSNQIAYMATTPVISGGDFVAYNLQKLTVPGIKPAYAAPGGIGGVGYRSLFPVLQLWSLMRNIAYLFFAIIFVIVGMLIILGKKLDPKTTLTIQAALPKIIISLVLVTFSYAIAGFVIDLMYVVIALTFSVLGPLLDNANKLKLGGHQALLDSILRGEIIFAFFFRTPWLEAAGGVQAATDALAGQIISGLTGGLTTGGIVKDVLGFGAGILINLILVIAVFYALFKIWLKLIMTYIQIILAVIVGPFFIMMDAIPKPNQSNFMTWLRGLLGNAMIYPVTILMLLVGMLISAGVGQSGIGDGSFIAPLTGIGNAGVAQVIIGLGMLLSIPAVLEKVPGWFGVGKGSLGELANAWGPTMAGAAAFTANNPVSKRLGRDWTEQRATEEDYLKKKRGEEHLKRVKEKYGDLDTDMPPPIDAELARRAMRTKQNLRVASGGPFAAARLSGHSDSNAWEKAFSLADADEQKRLMANLKGITVSGLTYDDYVDMQALGAQLGQEAAMRKVLPNIQKMAEKKVAQAEEDRKKAMERAGNIGSHGVVGRLYNVLGYAAKPMEWLSKAAGGK